jgi:hypothetical protein
MKDWADASPEEIRLTTSIGLLFGFDSALKEFVFDPRSPRLRHRPGILRDEAWRFDTAQQCKVKAALDIWSGAGHLRLFEMLEEWDQQGWTDFIKAICLLKEINPIDIEDEDLAAMGRFLASERLT